MELRKGTVSPISVSVPNDAQNTTAEFFVDDAQVGNIQSLTVNDGVATFTPPYAAVANEGSLRVDIQFAEQSEYYTKSVSFDVVTPYLEIMDLRKVMDNSTDDDRWNMESVVRTVIDAYTGQHFAQTTKTLVARGTGDDFLRLPERLIELQGLDTLTTTLNNADSIITGDGWYLKKGWTTGSDYHSTDNLYFQDIDPIWPFQAPVGEPGYQKLDHGRVISAPQVGVTSTTWQKDYPFQITGRWGYEFVPKAVREAALLLVNDYACNEVLYRDRYLDSIKYSDTSLQFDGLTWFGTGNARADMMLSEYVTTDWAVL